MSKFYELYESLILFEADPVKDEENTTDDETPTDDTTEDQTTDDTASDTNIEDESDTTEEEPIEAPEEKDYSELEIQAKSEARVEDISEEISDKMLEIAMERFDAFRKVLKKKGIEQMTIDFIDNYYTPKMNNKVDSLFIDLYADDIKAKTMEKIKHALTDLSLKKDEVESEPVPEKETDQFWSM